MMMMVCDDFSPSLYPALVSFFLLFFFEYQTAPLPFRIPLPRMSTRLTRLLHSSVTFNAASQRAS